jgi:hypothetical protein
MPTRPQGHSTLQGVARRTSQWFVRACGVSVQSQRRLLTKKNTHTEEERSDHSLPAYPQANNLSTTLAVSNLLDPNLPDSTLYVL